MPKFNRFITVLSLTLLSWAVLILAIYGAVRLLERICR